MAISVDTVYQKVLAIANKEQRGYITPQEFKLLASKAQLEIYDSYFDNVKTAFHKPKNQQSVAFDEIEMIQQKLHPFRAESSTTSSTATLTLPSDLYYLNNISTSNGSLSEMTRTEILYTENNPLTKATTKRMSYVRESGDTIRVYPTPTESTTFSIHYYKKPLAPEWSYVVVNKQALYDSTSTNLQNFELHTSEEEALVNKILYLAGVIVQNAELQQAAAIKEQLANQEKNN
jgi:hypothetical protein